MRRRLLAVSLILPLVDVCYPQLVRVPYSSADGSRLLILALANGFHDGFCAVLLRRWLGRSLIRSLVNGFHDGLRAVLLSGWQRIAPSSTRQRFSRWIARRIVQRMARRIAHSFARQRLSQRFARRIAQRMAADCSYFRS